VFISMSNAWPARRKCYMAGIYFGDTFWGANEAGKTWTAMRYGNPGSTCGRTSCHDMTAVYTSRVQGDPACPDCHGVYKNANGGTWPVISSVLTKIRSLWKMGTGHPNRIHKCNLLLAMRHAIYVAWGSSSCTGCQLLIFQVIQPEPG